jgi:beta-lactamase class D
MKFFIGSITSLFLILVISSCKRGNVEVDRDLEKYFTPNKLSGSFGMFDNGHGQFTLYNYNGFKDSAYAPAQFFNIINNLIALETGVATNDSTTIPWDNFVTNNPDFNKDLTLSQTFNNNSPNHYNTLARTIGKGYMAKYLDSLKLGNYKSLLEDTANWSKNLGDFWLNNTLKITADEMLGFTKKLYFIQLPGFQKRSHQIVTKMLLQETKDSLYSLSYKTAEVTINNNQQIGWITGWIEENKHPYFFVLNLVNNNAPINMQTTLTATLKQILTEKDFFKGKK